MGSGPLLFRAPPAAAGALPGSSTARFGVSPVPGVKATLPFTGKLIATPNPESAPFPTTTSSTRRWSVLNALRTMRTLPVPAGGSTQVNLRFAGGCTVTPVLAVAVPPGPVAVSVYVIVSGGVTVTEVPLTAPTP